MLCEPLKNKKQKMIKEATGTSSKNDFYLGFKKGIDDSFNVFI